MEVAPVAPDGPVGPGTVEAAPGAPEGPVGPGTLEAAPVAPEGPVGPVTVEVAPGAPEGPVGPATVEAAPGAPEGPVGPVTVEAAPGAPDSRMRSRLPGGPGPRRPGAQAATALSGPGPAAGEDRRRGLPRKAPDCQGNARTTTAAKTQAGEMGENPLLISHHQRRPQRPPATPARSKKCRSATGAAKQARHACMGAETALPQRAEGPTRASPCCARGASRAGHPHEAAKTSPWGTSAHCHTAPPQEVGRSWNR